MGTGGGRKPSKEAVKISKQKNEGSPHTWGLRKEGEFKRCQGDHNGIWDSEGRGREASRRIPRFPNQTTEGKRHSVLWHRDGVAKEMEVSSLLDMSRLTCLGCGASEYRHLKGS